VCVCVCVCVCVYVCVVASYVCQYGRDFDLWVVYVDECNDFDNGCL
jgi:hypothetical protein